jgi:hypothetical protein
VSLREWQKQQRAQKDQWENEQREYGEMARNLHRLFQSLALAKTSAYKPLGKYYSLETSSFWPHLLKTARIVIENEYDPRQYLKAQFEYFAEIFKDIPLPTQLHTSNAIDRYIRYAGKQRVSVENKRIREANVPKQSTNARSKERMKYWEQRIALLSRPRGGTDRDALLAHCTSIPADVLVAKGVWDEVREQWEAHQR